MRAKNLIEKYDESSSVGGEIRHFFRQGIPLGIQAVFAFGIPPLFAIFIAGHTSNSAHLQTVMGYGRTFYNIVGKMPTTGCFQYMFSVVPAAVGAGRKDRLASYFYRSLLLVFIASTPGFILMCLAKPIMIGIGISDAISTDVGIYCFYMLLTQFFYIIVMNLVIIFTSLKYNITVAFVAFVGGVCVDMLCSYFFIYKFDWGIRGVALAQISVTAAQVIAAICLIKCYGLWDLFFVRSSDAKLFDRKEIKIFRELCLPKIIMNFGSWFVFELQLIFITHVHGITPEAVAAAAIWIQTETALASIQTGWIRVSVIRVMELLGQLRPKEARNSFWIMSVCAFIVVAIYNVVFYFYMDQIAEIMTSDHEVQSELKKIIWLLIPHSQSRISALMSFAILPAINRGFFANISVYTCYYGFGMISGILFGLKDWFFRDIMYQTAFCLSMAIIAQIVMFFINSVYFSLLDWMQVAQETNERANSDKSKGYDQLQEDIDDPLGSPAIQS